MILVIDRFIGNKVVCINDTTGKEMLFDKNIIPNKSKEGDVLIYKNGTITYEKNLTLKKIKETDNLLNNIFK